MFLQKYRRGNRAHFRMIDPFYNNQLKFRGPAATGDGVLNGIKVVSEGEGAQLALIGVPVICYSRSSFNK